VDLEWTLKSLGNLGRFDGEHWRFFRGPWVYLGFIGFSGTIWRNVTPDCPEFTFVFNGRCFSHWFHWIIWNYLPLERPIALNLPLFSMGVVFIG